jgi:hypothetical protein
MEDTKILNKEMDESVQGTATMIEGIQEGSKKTLSGKLRLSNEFF